MRNLDDKLNAVYQFTSEYIVENGFPPSVREICAKCGVKSTATAYSYLQRLEDRGLLIKSPQKKRAISITEKAKRYNDVPLIGTIRAGAPIFALENLDGYIPLPDEFSSSNESFALRVQGDSMINAGIYNGDIIIVSAQQTASNGEIVVALIDDSATVKRFYLKNGTVVLHPENDNMEDMVFDNVKILGVVKGLMRKF